MVIISELNCRFAKRKLLPVNLQNNRTKSDSEADRKFNSSTNVYIWYGIVFHNKLVYPYINKVESRLSVYVLTSIYIQGLSIVDIHHTRILYILYSNLTTFYNSFSLGKWKVNVNYAFISLRRPKTQLRQLIINWNC